MAGSYVDTLVEIFERNRERELLTDVRTGERLSYGRLLDDSLNIAAFLKEQGVTAGTPVALSMENSVELATLCFACMHLRARLVPISPALHPRDYASILDGETDLFLMVTPTVRARVADVLAARPALRVLSLRTAAEPVKEDRQALLNMDFAAERACRRSEVPPWDGAHDEDVFLTIYTSGTTSTPKGIDVCYGGLLGNGLAFCRRLGLGPESRFYNVLPMTYLGGLYNLMLIPILAEGSFVLDSAFGVSNLYSFWENVRTYGVNIPWFTSTMLSMLLSVAEEEEQDTAFLKEQVRFGLCGMAPLPVNLKQRFEQRFGLALYENYGISETTFLTTNHPGLPYRAGSAGTPLPEVEVQIVDQELQPMPAGSEGQILVRTPYFMKGYRNCAGSDQENVQSLGAFLTGDLGRLDEAGELSVTGRLKDLIIRGGINISPRAVEETIYGMEEVEEVAVVGVPHPIYGEEVAAVVKVRRGYADGLRAADVKSFCERHIANFQRPKLVYFIDELPRGATGKVQKVVLRRLIAEKLNPLGI